MKQVSGRVLIPWRLVSQYDTCVVAHVTSMCPVVGQGYGGLLRGLAAGLPATTCRRALGPSCVRAASTIASLHALSWAVSCSQAMLQLYIVLSANAGLMELCAEEHSQLKLSLALSFIRCPYCRAPQLLCFAAHILYR